MEIDITSFFENADPFEFSHSRAEGGPDAGPNTWNAAKREGAESPLLTTPEQIEALRDHVRGFGAWSDEEIAAWDDAECNALFIQMVSGDIREGGLDQPGTDTDSPEWDEYEKGAEEGLFAGRISRSAGRIYYYLGD